MVKKNGAPENVTPAESAREILPMLRRLCLNDEQTLRDLVRALHREVFGPSLVVSRRSGSNPTTKDGKEPFLG